MQEPGQDQLTPRQRTRFERVIEAPASSRGGWWYSSLARRTGGRLIAVVTPEPGPR